MSMRKAAKILQFAVLVAGVTGTLKHECDIRTSGERSRLGGRLSDLQSSHPSSQYKTFCDPTPPALETWHSKQPCADGLLFVAPGEAAAGSSTGENEADVEGPSIFRTNGELVWTQSGWGRTSDLKVQTVGDRSYITFWHDKSSRHEGGGSYVVVSYRVMVQANGAANLRRHLG